MPGIEDMHAPAAEQPETRPEVTRPADLLLPQGGLRVTLVIVASLLLFAHFLRSFTLLPMVVSLLLPLLLRVRRPWAIRVTQAWLLLGAALWVLTMVIFVQQRQQAGVPWGRMALILGAVAALTAVAALLLRVRREEPVPAKDIW